MTRAFAECGIGVQPVEVSQSNNAAVRYRASLTSSTSLEDVNAHLADPIDRLAGVEEGPGVTRVSVDRVVLAPEARRRAVIDLIDGRRSRSHEVRLHGVDRHDCGRLAADRLAIFATEITHY